MTPDPAALAVLLDAARACYGDDSEQVRWLLHPDAVRELLRSGQYSFDPMESVCNSCGQFHDIAHLQGCSNAAAWRDLGDPRGAADIERAHEEALHEQRTRTEPPFTGGWMGREGARIRAGMSPEGQVRVRLSAGARFLSFGTGLGACQHDRVALRYTQRQVDGPRSVFGSLVEVFTENICSACGHVLPSDDTVVQTSMP